jgi:N6-L-threonylcarbamoyladenine synthase
MIILGIETSCDDTAAAVLRDGHEIMSNVISSQEAYHAKYGGIVPEIASRRHQENIIPVVSEALERAGVTLDDIDGISVTKGPGLAGSLLVGLNVAKAIAYSRTLPLIGINHLEGHLLAPHLAGEVPMPNVTLVVSGGHTNLYHVQGIGSYSLLGGTRDDAAGEAFDKVAKMLNLGYPGGVVIDRLAAEGDPEAIRFPRPMLKDDNHEFSFSGLKTAVRNYIVACGLETITPDHLRNLAASFQEAVVEILVKKTIRAARQLGVNALAVSGGVACNSRLRAYMQEQGSAAGLEVHLPPPVLCTDNAVMIALAGFHRMSRGEVSSFPFDMNATSRLPL